MSDENETDNYDWNALLDPELLCQARTLAGNYGESLPEFVNRALRNAVEGALFDKKLDENLRIIREDGDYGLLWVEG